MGKKINIILNTIYFLLFILLGFVLGHRDFSFGTDTEDYAKLFASGFNSPAIRDMFENGFVAYTQLFQYISNDPRDYILSLSLISTIIFSISGGILMKGWYRILFFIFMISSPFIIQLIVNAIRQGIAFGILLVFMSIFIVRWQSVSLGVIFSYISYFIHIPTMMNAIVFFNKTRWNMLYIWILLVFISLFAKFYTPLFESLFRTTKYIGYFTSINDIYRTGFRIEFFTFSMLILPIIIVKKFENYNKSTRYFINCYFIINGISFLFNELSFSSRFITLSWSFLPYIYCMAISNISKTINGLYIKVTLSVIYLASCFMIFIISK